MLCRNNGRPTVGGSGRVSRPCHYEGLLSLAGRLGVPKTMEAGTLEDSEAVPIILGTL